MQPVLQEPPGTPAPRGSEPAVKVLAVTAFEQDHTYLKHTFHHTNWKIEWARSRADARVLLASGSYAVMLCDEDLPDSSWREILVDVETLPNPPVFVVASATAGDPLWAEVLNVGGYDLLVKPFDRREVVRVMSQAWRQWRSPRSHG